MKKAVLLTLIFVSAIALAQSDPQASTPAGTVSTSVNFPVERVQTPTATDLYCAGFLSKPISKDRYISGGMESPHTTRFVDADAIYLNGKGYEGGQRFTVVRELKDPNRYEIFKGQWSAVKAAGQPYEELARVRVIDNRGKMAIAQVEFSCDTILPGDYLIPYVDKSSVAFHPAVRFDRFAPATGQPSGRILLAKDFDSELGTGGKVYINLGSSQGLKVGDYVRAVRTGNAVAHDPVDSLSYKSSTTEVTQTKQAAVNPNFITKTGGPVILTADMPRRTVAEIVVIGTTPSTAAGMIVFSMEPVHLGDIVEVDQQ